MTRKKKKKKGQRSVSFSETVTEYRVEGTVQDDVDNCNVDTVVTVEAPIKDENESKVDRLGVFSLFRYIVMFKVKSCLVYKCFCRYGNKLGEKLRENISS